MRDGKKRTKDAMSPLLDQERVANCKPRWEDAELPTTLDELVKLGHLLEEMFQPERHWKEGELVARPSVYAITKAGLDFDGFARVSKPCPTPDCDGVLSFLTDAAKQPVRSSAACAQCGAHGRYDPETGKVRLSRER